VCEHALLRLLVRLDLLVGGGLPGHCEVQEEQQLQQCVEQARCEGLVTASQCAVVPLGDLWWWWWSSGGCGSVWCGSGRGWWVGLVLFEGIGRLGCLQEGEEGGTSGSSVTSKMLVGVSFSSSYFSFFSLFLLFFFFSISFSLNFE
jgi:hypothetical protein